MAADNSFETILLKALLWCGVCYIIGYVAGSIGQVVTHEHAHDLAKRVAAHDAKVAADKEEAARKAAAEALEATTAGPAPAPSPDQGRKIFKVPLGKRRKM